jgi:transposase-like protein
MKPVERSTARMLRQDGRSIGSIASELGIARSSVSRWVADIELSPEQHARLASSDPLHPRRTNAAAVKRRSALELRRQAQAAGRAGAAAGRPLHAVGCALLWAEGSKLRNSVTLINSDPELIATFVRFLRECFAVPDERIALSVNVHLNNGLSLDEMHGWWRCTRPRSFSASTARSRCTAPSSGRRGWPDGARRAS